MKSFRKLLDNDRGANLVEYGLIVAVIALVAFAAVSILGHRTEETFTTAAGAFHGGDVSGGQSGGEVDDVDSGAGDHGDSDQNDAGGQQQPDDQTGPGPTNDDSDQVEADENAEDDDFVAEDEADLDPGSGGEVFEDDSDDGAVNEATDGTDHDDDGQEGPGESGDQSGGAGGQGGGGDDSAQPALPGYSDLAGTDSEFFWWNRTNVGGYGAWKASASFENDTNRHQYLQLLVTRVDDTGVVTTTTVNGFYVPANGSSTYTLWDNQYRLENGVATGVVEVKVQVVAVTTSDKNWKSFSFDVDPNETSVPAPSR